MKPLYSILLFVALTYSCKKGEDAAPSHFQCETVLDKWKINVLPLPEVQRQNDLFFVSEETGYTVGNAGTILKTTNGGQDWEFVERYYDLTTNTIVAGALTKARLTTVHFVNETVGYVGGGAENIPISGGNIDAVLLKTTDGGNTWSKQYLPAIREVKNLYFFDADNGLAVFLSYDQNNYLKNRLFETHDAGATWEAVPLPNNLTVQGSRIDITPSSVGVWVVEDYVRSKYLRSTDQGDTWQEVPIPSDECIGISFQTDEIGFAYCDAVSYRTTNGGGTWQDVTDFLVAGAVLNHFHNLEEGFAIVPVYDIRSGGGESWQELNSFEVYQTTDGGITWERSVIDKECDFTGTRFTYSNEVFFTLGGNAVNKFEMK